MMGFFWQFHLEGLAIDGHIQHAVFQFFYTGSIVLATYLELIFFHVDVFCRTSLVIGMFWGCVPSLPDVSVGP